MRIYILEGNEVVDLTYDEELELAASVMTVIYNRGAYTEHADIANDLYYAGTHGHVIRLSVLEEFLEYTIKLILRYEEHGKAHLAPKLFDPVNNGKCHTAPGETRTGDEINRSEWYTVEQIRAWREVWEQHRVELSKMDDYYRVFPGDEDGQSRENDRVLIKFFIEVISTMAQYKMSFHQVLADVKDRTPHAGMTLDELNSARGKFWDEAQKQYDQIRRKGKRPMTPKMIRIKEMVERHKKMTNPVNICDGGKDNKAPAEKNVITDAKARELYEQEKADYEAYLRGKG